MSKRETIIRALKVSRLLPLLKTHARWNGLLVLNHHRIGDPAASPFDRAVYSATPEALGEQIALLKRDADIIAPADVASVLERPTGRHILLTFDDGYRDNYDLAFPILRSHGIQASFFLCSGFIDHQPVPWWDEIAWMVRSSNRQTLPAGEWFDEPVAISPDQADAAIKTILSRYKTLMEERQGPFVTFLAEETGSGRCPAELGKALWITWDMAREMASAGMDIGGHTVTHPVLSSIPLASQRAEIEGCQERLIAELGFAPTRFAYPVGGRTTFTPETQAIVREAGYEMAFSFYGGYGRRGHQDLYDVPRLYVSPETTLDSLEAMLAIPQLLARETPQLPPIVQAIRSVFPGR